MTDAGTLTGLLDADKLTAWLDANIPTLGSGPLKAQMIHGGASTVIPSLDRDYAAGTGRDIAAFDHDLILAMDKGGCILEYKVAQAAAGILSKETGELFSRLVLGNVSEAERLARQAG
jgi:hypothetical protein